MTAMGIESTDKTTGWTDRHTAVAGIAFGVLMVGGVIVGGGTPSNTAPAEEWVDWWSDSGNRAQQIVGIFLAMLAAAALVGFVAGLVQRARRDQGGTTPMAFIAAAGGVILATSLMVGAIVARSASGAIEFGDIPVPSGDILIMVEQMGYGIMLLGSGVGAFLLLGGTSLISGETRMLPTWLAISGLVAAFILLFTSALFMPMVLIPLWSIAVSVTLLRRH